jgi:hypothetical protein
MINDLARSRRVTNRFVCSAKVVVEGVDFFFLSMRALLRMLRKGVFRDWFVSCQLLVNDQ